MQRNRNDHFSNIPTPSLPRSVQDFGVHSITQTLRHGRLTPFYCRMVYPGSTLKQDMQCFIRMDTSVRVPLQNVYIDNYYFFVPIRILDPNFAKILGDKTYYDTNQYNFPTMELDGTMDKDSVLGYLGYGAITTQHLSASSSWTANDIYWTFASGLGYYNATKGGSGNVDAWDKICTYSLAAYYKIWNEYFRDETLDYEIPIDNILVQGSSVSQSSLQANSLWDGLHCLPVNKYHDFATSGLITPIKGNDVTIPLGNSLVPIIGDSRVHNMNNPIQLALSAGGVTAGKYALYWDSGTSTSIGTVKTNAAAASATMQNIPLGYSNLVADMSKATGASIQQLYTSLALYSLYDKRGTFGTRLIEQIRGQFGLTVPDGLLDRAEYLGGSCESLNNIPVLNTTSTDQGQMVGNSATLSGRNSFDKSFNEWGFVIGLSVTRIKHVYGQAITEPSLKMFDDLDMYWPVFANIGKVPLPNNRVVNNPRKADNIEVFNYNEPWLDQHLEIDRVAGEFGSFHTPTVSEFEKIWTYQDIYDGRPVFSSGWLKEPEENLNRTLSGTLLPNSTSGGHQFMIQYSYRTRLTMAIPVHPHVPNITGRI